MVLSQPAHARCVSNGGDSRMRRALAWVTPAVVVVELSLVAGGVLSPARAVLLFVLAEAAIAVVGLTVIVAAVHHYRSAASTGTGSRWEAAQSALRSVLPRRAAQAIGIEARAWWALARWLRHRRPGRGEFSYGHDLRPLLAMSFQHWGCGVKGRWRPASGWAGAGGCFSTTTGPPTLEWLTLVAETSVAPSA